MVELARLRRLLNQNGARRCAELPRRWACGGSSGPASGKQPTLQWEDFSHLPLRGSGRLCGRCATAPAEFFCSVGFAGGSGNRLFKDDSTRSKTGHQVLRGKARYSAPGGQATELGRATDNVAFECDTAQHGFIHVLQLNLLTTRLVMPAVRPERAATIPARSDISECSPGVAYALGGQP